LNGHKGFIVSHGEWLEKFGEVELIGGWAEVALDEEFAALIEASDYQVFLTSYGPVLLFVQNRTARSFEIHTLPVLECRRQFPARCGYRIVGRRAIRADPLERGYNLCPRIHVRNQESSQPAPVSPIVGEHAL
jgi:hypothetical protein